MQESRTITRNSASNLALAFVLLPKAKREGMSALYAFCREVDDVADDESVPATKRRATLDLWRQDIRRACGSETPHLQVNRELQPVIHQYRLPFELLNELLRGVEMDLETKRYDDWNELELYCHRVASVVGLLSIEIFGYSNPRCREYAVFLGKALQLTNILRDVRNDAERGRVYLPKSELKLAGVSPEEVLRLEYSPRYTAAASRVADRAESLYRSARQCLPPEDLRSMGTAELMGAVYWELLQKLRRDRFDVFGPRPPRLSKARKLVLVMRAWLRLTIGGASPSYGA